MHFLAVKPVVEKATLEDIPGTNLKLISQLLKRPGACSAADRGNCRLLTAPDVMSTVEEGSTGMLNSRK